jgi:hypothetical protein
VTYGARSQTTDFVTTLRLGRLESSDVANHAQNSPRPGHELPQIGKQVRARSPSDKMVTYQSFRRRFFLSQVQGSDEDEHDQDRLQLLTARPHVARLGTRARSETDLGGNRQDAAMAAGVQMSNPPRMVEDSMLRAVPCVLLTPQNSLLPFQTTFLLSLLPFHMSHLEYRNRVNQAVR